MNKKIKRQSRRKEAKREKPKSREIRVSQKDQYAKRRREVIVPASPRLFEWNDK